MSSSVACMPSSRGSPLAAAASTVGSVVAATTTGGRGSVAGRGTSGTGRKRKKRDRSSSAATRPCSSPARRRSSESGKPSSNRARPVPNTSRSTHGPPRPTPRAKRPPERWSRRAVSSASATGWRLESMHTAVGGEGDGRGAHAVGDEVVLGDPDAVQAGPFGGDGGVRGSGQRLALGHARELPGEQEDAELHRPMCRCRSAGLSSPGGRATD